MHGSDACNALHNSCSCSVDAAMSQPLPGDALAIALGLLPEQTGPVPVLEAHRRTSPHGSPRSSPRAPSTPRARRLGAGSASPGVPFDLSPGHSPLRSPAQSPARSPLAAAGARTPTALVMPMRLMALKFPGAPASSADPEKPEKRGRLTFTLAVSSLRDDFYCTFIVGVPELKVMVVTTGKTVHGWHDQRGRYRLHIGDTYGYVQCMSLSKEGLLAVSYSEGTIVIYNTKLDVILCQAQIDKKIKFSHLAWQPDSMFLFAGTTSGSICRLTVLHDQTPIRITYIFLPMRHGGTICKICFSPAGYMAVGSDDYRVSVWRVSMTERPECLDKVVHGGAVRALQFCPWLPTLLVSGSGRHERRIKGWDVVTKRVYFQFYIQNQITDVVWLGRWEIFVAHGHAELLPNGQKVKPADQILGQVWDVVNCKALSTIKGHGRAHAAVPTATGVCISSSQRCLLYYRWTPLKNPPSIVSLVGERATGLR